MSAKSILNWLIIMSAWLISPLASADWYYYVMKVECTSNELRIIDYSEYNELGLAQSKEADAIDVDTLSTWKTTDDGLNVPDKPLPYIKVCETSSGKYKVVLTNAGGGYSAPYPVVTVFEISNPSFPKILIENMSLNFVVENRYEIVFSKENPIGLIINE